MKNKWLIGIASAMLAVTMAFGFAACGGDETDSEGDQGDPSTPGTPDTPGEELTDRDIAKNAIGALKDLYLNNDEVLITPFNYEVLGRVKIGEGDEEDDYCNITWTASTDVEGVTISDVVSIGAMTAEYSVPITVTRTDKEVPYKLTASATVGEATETFSFNRKLPATAEVHGDLTYKFDAVKHADYSENYGKLDAAKALTILQAAGEASGIASVDEATSVYAGNDANQGGIGDKTDGYLKFGTGSGAGKLTITFAKAVNKIEIGAKGWFDGSAATESADKIDKISVNNSELQAPPADYDGLLVFEIEPATQVTIETTYRVFLFGIGAYYAPADAHVHVGDGDFTHIEGTWQHQQGCTAENCTNGGKCPPVDCEPVNNTCEACNTTYTLDEIFARVEAGTTMKGTYEMTGVITSDVTKGDSGDLHFNMAVTVGSATKQVIAFYTDPGSYTGVAKGDTVTIQGALTLYNDTAEFTNSEITDYHSATESMDDQQKADATITALALDTMTKEYYNLGDFDLPNSTRYGATVTWTVTTDTNSYVEIKNGTTLTIKGLPETGEATVTLTVTATSNDKTATQTVTIKLLPEREEMVFKAIEAATAGDYIFALYQGNLNKWLYSTGAISTNTNGNFGATTEDATKAATYTLTASGEGWTITLKTAPEAAAAENVGKLLELDSNHRITYVASSTQVWNWNEANKVFTFAVGTDTYYIGTYSTFDTFSASTVSFLSGSSNYAAKFGTLSEITNADKAERVLDEIAEPSKLDFYADDQEEGITLTTATSLSAKYHATIAWSVSNELSSYITITGGTLTITSLPEGAAVTGTLTVTVTVGEGEGAGTATNSFTVTVNPADAEEPAPQKFVAIETPAAAQQYIFSVMYKGARRYVSSLDLDGNYLATSDDIKAAVTFTLEASGTNWLIKLGDKYLEVNPYTNTSKNYTSYNLRLVASPTENAVWEWDSTYKTLKQKPVATETLTTTVADAYYYLGMRDDSTFTTLSPSDIKYLSSAPDTNHAAQFGTLADMTEEDMANDVLASLKLTQTTYSELNTDGIDLPTSEKYDAVVTWSVNESAPNAYVSVSANKLCINTLPTGNSATVELKVEVRVGESTVSKTVEITVTSTATVPNDGSADHPYTAAEAKAAAKALVNTGTKQTVYSTQTVYVHGYVVAIDQASVQYKNYTFYIGVTAESGKTSDDAIEVYRLAADTQYLILADDLYIGAEITVCGYLSNYNNSSFEVAENNSVKPTTTAYTDTRDGATKANTAIQSAKKVLDALIITNDKTEYTLPVSTVTGVTLEYSASSGVDAGKLTVTHTAEEQKITINISATGGTAATATVTVEAKAPDRPEDAKDVTVSIATYGAAHGWDQNTQSKSLEVDNNIEVTLDASDGNSGKFYTPQWRIYQKGSPKIIFTAKNNATIFSVKITYETNSNGILTDAAGTKQIASDMIVYVQGSSVTFSVGYTGTDGANNGQVRITNIEVTYTGGATLTDEDIAQGALDSINVTETELTEDLVLPTTSVEGVTLNWTIEGEGAAAAAKIEPVDGGGYKIKVTRQESDVTFTLKVTATYNGKTTQPKSFPDIIVKRALKEGEVEIDFTKNWSTYTKTDWTSSYAAHEITFEELGEETVEGSVNLSFASNGSGGNVKNMPAMAANAATASNKVAPTIYATVHVTTGTIKSVSFTLAQWGTSKKFSKIVIEYSTDGSDWHECSAVLGSVTKSDYVIDAEGTVLTSTSIPEGVAYVRLSITTTAESNQQLGLSAIKLEMNPAAAAAANVAPAQVAMLPDED